MARMHSRCRKHTGFVRSVRRVWRYRLAALHDGWSWWVSCQREPAAHGVRALSRPRVVDHLQRGDTALRRSSLTRAGGLGTTKGQGGRCIVDISKGFQKRQLSSFRNFCVVSPGNHPPSDPDLGHRGRGTQWRDSSLKGAGNWRTGFVGVSSSLTTQGFVISLKGLGFPLLSSEHTTAGKSPWSVPAADT